MRGGEAYIGGTTTHFETNDMSAAFPGYDGAPMYQYNEMGQYVCNSNYQYDNSGSGAYVPNDPYKVNSVTFDTTLRSNSFPVNGVYNKVGETDHSYRPPVDVAQREDPVGGYQVDHYGNIHRMVARKDYDDVHRTQNHGLYGMQNRDKAPHERDPIVAYSRYENDERNRHSAGHEHYYSSYTTNYDRLPEKDFGWDDALRSYSKTHRHNSRDGSHRSEKYAEKLLRRERERSARHGSYDKYKHSSDSHKHRHRSGRGYYGGSDSDDRAHYKRKSSERDEWVEKRSSYSRSDYYSASSTAGPKSIPVIQSRY